MGQAGCRLASSAISGQKSQPTDLSTLPLGHMMSMSCCLGPHAHKCWFSKCCNLSSLACFHNIWALWGMQLTQNDSAPSSLADMRSPCLAVASGSSSATCIALCHAHRLHVISKSAYLCLSSWLMSRCSPHGSQSWVAPPARTFEVRRTERCLRIGTIHQPSLWPYSSASVHVVNTSQAELRDLRPLIATVHALQMLNPLMQTLMHNMSTMQGVQLFTCASKGLRSKTALSHACAQQAYPEDDCSQRETLKASISAASSAFAAASARPSSSAVCTSTAAGNSRTPGVLTCTTLAQKALHLPCNQELAEAVRKQCRRRVCWQQLPVWCSELPHLHRRASGDSQVGIRRWCHDCPNCQLCVRNLGGQVGNPIQRHHRCIHSRLQHRR